MIEQSTYLRKAINEAIALAKSDRVEYVCPEHLLFVLASQVPFEHVLTSAGIDPNQLKMNLVQYLNEMEVIPDGEEYELEASKQLNSIMSATFQYAESAQINTLDIPHLVSAMLEFEDCWATHTLLEMSKISKAELMVLVIDAYKIIEDLGKELEEQREKPWLKYTVCMNDVAAAHSPLIGREAEMERTLQVLCRHDKNHVLHIGEPGVGKTALVWGLAQRLVQNDVPKRLQGYKLYELDITAIISGAQYQGEIESRIKSVMEGITDEGNPIAYIDNIHNLAGAGRNGDGAMDAMKILQSYMEREDLRIIGTTTYQDFNHHLAKQRGMLRRFQQIDIAEPSKDDTLRIVESLLPRYESFHKVKFEKGIVEYAVDMSIRHMNDRCLPDKAIDLIDEAGAWRELHPQMRKVRGEMTVSKTQKIDKQVINTLLSRICRINAETLTAEDNDTLQTLTERIKAQIYGQDEAVQQVVSGIEMAKAGLLDDEKPLASLLFVGPTGVGKTEVARVLAKELGIELIRFDMSEYTEKHTVAKLIGSPAGYVGYEDGGLLTDAIRKTPNCVLLLDEIEKAHSDIYNILLQVMDYARLTDNRGNKADFRNVVLIMTSNAGAQYAAQASVGFDSNVTSGEAMMREVKKTFKPEFLNRLSGTVVFHDMDRTMAELILEKKLRELRTKLASKNIEMGLTLAAHDLLLEKGFTTRYGAREIDRVIRQMLTPLLMREILYGSLKKGGDITIDALNEQLTIVD